MNDRWRLPKAIVKRELVSYFSNPTGYVFITLFVFLSAVAAFWQEAFFANNLANLDSLNRVIPYLLVFLIPAITMSTWAEDKRNGTDELLLTLPATDLEIVAGKYLAALGIYSVALMFSVSHVVVLCWLGSPDMGLMFSTYLGYWLMGAAMLALGMLASLMTSNLTVAFILGAVFCAAPVFIHHAGVILTGRLRRLAEGLSFTQQFEGFSTGVISLSAILYFLCFALAMLYLNVGLLGRRHWPSGKGAEPLGWHYLARGLALMVAVAGLTILTARLGGRLDATAEGLHSLSDQTRQLIAGLDPNRPVFIQAFLSPHVPRSYLQTRNDIVNILREFGALGNGRIHTRVIETEKYTPEAREAQERFGIQPRPVPPGEQSPGSADEIFFGVVFNGGAQEFVIPFFDTGLPVEYELMRSVGAVSDSEQKKIGMVTGRVKMFGGFDFQTKQNRQDWSIVLELSKQYLVQKLTERKEYPDDLDALIAVLPHTFTETEMTRVVDFVRSGKPVMVLVDPLPAFDIEMSPQMGQRNPFTPSASPPQPPTDVTPLMEVLGVVWDKNEIVWDKYNPHPRLGKLPPEIVFVGAGNEAASEAFNPEEAVTSGLQEVVLLHSGVLKPAEGAEDAFIPLLRTGEVSGKLPWSRLVQRSIMGTQLTPNVPHEPDTESYVVAARIEGQSGDKPVRAIVIADVDMMGEQFFELRRRGVENLNFDNVTFLLNAMDQLLGDASFIDLRKRRPRHRTLEAVEARTRVHEERRIADARRAEQRAEESLKAAQARLDKAVEAVRNRADLDSQTKQIMIANQQRAENRRLTVTRKNIEDEKQREVERSRAEMESSIRGIQDTIKLLAVILPPIPAFALFVFVSVGRLRREKLGVSPGRLVKKE